jgi:hypothetical protein
VGEGDLGGRQGKPVGQLDRTDAGCLEDPHAYIVSSGTL